MLTLLLTFPYLAYSIVNNKEVIDRMRKLIGFRIDTDVVEALIYKVNAKTQNEAIEFAINYTLINYENEINEDKDNAIKTVIEEYLSDKYEQLFIEHSKLKKDYGRLLLSVMSLKDAYEELLELGKDK